MEIKRGDLFLVKAAALVKRSRQTRNQNQLDGPLGSLCQSPISVALAEGISEGIRRGSPEWGPQKLKMKRRNHLLAN
jgi:hypothetical protein